MTMMRPTSRPWFNPSSPADRALTTYTLDEPQLILEFDELEIMGEWIKEVARLQTGSNQKGNIDFLVFQNWGPATPQGRSYFFLNAERATELGGYIKISNCQKLMLIVTTFQKGALKVLADSIDKPMAYVGLLWYFSGDDITDEACFPEEIGYLAKKLQLRRLAILTGAFNESVEKKLAECLAEASSLEVVSIHHKDDEARYPKLPTPLIEATLKRS